MSKWDDQKWGEIIGRNKLDWSLVVGLPLQGKTTLAKVLQS
jgi:Holliday junction resolvasome RuvABC ATP-dependent DNA helicase subunit